MPPRFSAKFFSYSTEWLNPKLLTGLLIAPELKENFFDEYNKLLAAERDLTITDYQESILNQMRKTLKQNRKFAEKVIKYLLDDAFKFNAQDLFESSLGSLEFVIRHFVFAHAQGRFDIFNQNVRDILFKTAVWYLPKQLHVI